jgi:hypothetical protein
MDAVVFVSVLCRESGGEAGGSLLGSIADIVVVQSDGHMV